MPVSGLFHGIVVRGVNEEGPFAPPDILITFHPTLKGYVSVISLPAIKQLSFGFNVG